jgi:hypothetical protein
VAAIPDLLIPNLTGYDVGRQNDAETHCLAIGAKITNKIMVTDDSGASICLLGIGTCRPTYGGPSCIATCKLELLQDDLDFILFYIFFISCLFIFIFSYLYFHIFIFILCALRGRAFRR